MVRVTPKTDEQFDAIEAERKAQWTPWPAGTICDYQILSAKDATSAKGNEMIVAEVRVFNEKGEQKDITDYIGEWNEYKLKRINPERYEAGLVEAQDLEGKTGKCKLGISNGQPKGDGTFYADKNDIKEYLKPVVASKEELDDEIPF